LRVTWRCRHRRLIHQGSTLFNFVVVAAKCAPGANSVVYDCFDTYGCRAFSVAGPMAWNSLRDFIRDPRTASGLQYSRHSCSRDTSASSALWVVNLLTSMRCIRPHTRSRTQSLVCGCLQEDPSDCGRACGLARPSVLSVLVLTALTLALTVAVDCGLH